MPGDEDFDMDICTGTQANRVPVSNYVANQLTRLINETSDMMSTSSAAADQSMNAFLNNKCRRIVAILGCQAVDVEQAQHSSSRSSLGSGDSDQQNSSTRDILEDIPLGNCQMHRHLRSRANLHNRPCQLNQNQGRVCVNPSPRTSTLQSRRGVGGVRS